MRDDLQYRARRVFADFIESFEERKGRRDWWLEFPQEELDKLGMSYDEVEGALELLSSEGLVERLSMDGWKLTDEGYRACRHRELIDQALGPPNAGSNLVLQVYAEQIIVGNNNTLQVNSDDVMRRLVEHLNADPALPEPKKKQWVEILKEITGHVAAEGLKVVIDKAMGK